MRGDHRGLLISFILVCGPLQIFKFLRAKASVLRRPRGGVGAGLTNQCFAPVQCRLEKQFDIEDAAAKVIMPNAARCRLVGLASRWFQEAPLAIHSRRWCFHISA